MKMNTLKINIIAILLCVASINTNAQICEWRLADAVYTAADPDGAGSATGSVTFKVQIHTTAGSIPNVIALSLGWSYQSTAAMVPTTPGCVTTNSPTNAPVAPGIFASGVYLYNAVNQCNNFTQNIGANTFNRTASGSLEGNPITITTTWSDIFTVTLWTLGTTYPQGGYAFINSGSGGSPNALGSYAVSDNLGNEYIANSLTATTPLALGTSVAPVTFTKFDANCNDNGTSLEWITSQEINSKYYAVEKSIDGINWKAITVIQAAGNSSTDKVYNYLDLNAGKASYRIKQVDIDGRFAYTNIASSNCTAKNIDIVIYPVPAKNNLNIAISANKNINTQLMIYDATGRLVKQLSEKIVTGNNTIQIDVTNLPSGQYILRSTDELLNINKKFTVLK